MVRVPGHRFGGPGRDSLRYHIFLEVVFLERGPFGIVTMRSYLNEKVAAPA
jgi:hypothetical protein